MKLQHVTDLNGVAKSVLILRTRMLQFDDGNLNAIRSAKRGRRQSGKCSAEIGLLLWGGYRWVPAAKRLRVRAEGSTGLDGLQLTLDTVRQDARRSRLQQIIGTPSVFGS
jgi:hypothetical protein